MRKIKLCIVFVIISNVLFLSGCQTGQTKTAAPEVLAEFDFSIKDGGILLPVTFNGEECTLALDTGASYTVVDDSFKDKLGKMISKPRKASTPYNKDKILMIERFSFPDAYLGNLKLKTSNSIYVMDLDPLTGGLCKGVIGMDFLEQYIVQIDFDNGKVIFLKGKKNFDIFSFLGPKENKHPEWGEPVKIKTRIFGNRRTVKGRVLGNISTDFMIDTGWGFSGVLKNNKFDKVKSNLYETDNETTFVIATENNSSMGNIVKTNRFSIGTFNYKEIMFQKGDISMLGLPFFSHHLVTFDFPNNIMYLKKGEKYGKQFGYLPYFKGTGLTLNVNDENIFVCQVDPNGLAERKGIKQNDIVMEFQVNDQILTSFKPLDFIEFSSKLPKPEDRTYIFTFNRGDEVFTVEFTKQDIQQKKD